MSNPQQSKIVLIGPEGVGKTCMLERLRTGEYYSTTEATIGASFSCRMIRTLKGTDVRLNIWDTAGQERFESILPMYVRGAKVAVVCISEPKVEDIQKYYNFVQYNSPETRIYIAITKSDLILDRRYYSAITKYAKTIQAKVFFTSSLTGDGVTELFADIADFIEELDPPSPMVMLELKPPVTERCCW